MRKNGGNLGVAVETAKQSGVDHNLASTPEAHRVGALVIDHDDFPVEPARPVKRLLGLVAQAAVDGADDPPDEAVDPDALGVALAEDHVGMRLLESGELGLAGFADGTARGDDEVRAVRAGHRLDVVPAAHGGDGDGHAVAGEKMERLGQWRKSPGQE